MHQPRRTAVSAFSSFDWALTLSLCIHGALLGTWLYWRHQQGGAISISQKRGGLTVQLAPVTPKPPTATVAPPARLPQPSRPSRTLLADAPIARTQLTNQPPALPSAPPSLPPSATPPAPEPPTPAETPTAQQAEPTPITTPPASAEQAGARFASLFAPIISRPLGHGRWTPQPARMPPESESAMQREQAIQGLRHNVQVQTDALRAELMAQPLTGTCAIHLALDRQAAQVQCDKDQDQNRIASRLGGILHLQPDLTYGASDSCLQLAGSQMRWEDCPAVAPP